ARGTDALVVDVSGGSTSLVCAGVDGSIVAAHVAPLGSGVAADRTVVRAGLDGVRRWIPWSIDAPTMLERVFNRARWPDAVAAEASALALEIALAHEAVSDADVESPGTPVKAHGAAGGLGVIVDGGGRPLVLPPRDAERLPARVKWFAALDLAVTGAA